MSRTQPSQCHTPPCLHAFPGRFKLHMCWSAATTTWLPTDAGASGCQHRFRKTAKPVLARAWQGLWKGVLPSLVMVSNPTVNYMLYEYLRARLEEWRALLAGGPRCGLIRAP